MTTVPKDQYHHGYNRRCRTGTRIRHWPDIRSISTRGPIIVTGCRRPSLTGQMYTRISHRDLACPVFSPTPELAADLPATCCVHNFIVRGVVPRHSSFRNCDTKSRGRKKTARGRPVRQRLGPPPPPSQPLITRNYNCVRTYCQNWKEGSSHQTWGALMHDHDSSSLTTCVSFRCVLVVPLGTGAKF